MAVTLLPATAANAGIAHTSTTITGRIEIPAPEVDQVLAAARQGVDVLAVYGSGPGPVARFAATASPVTVQERLAATANLSGSHAALQGWAASTSGVVQRGHVNGGVVEVTSVPATQAARPSGVGSGNTHPQVTPGNNFNYVTPDDCTSWSPGTVISHYAYCDAELIVLEHWLTEDNIPVELVGTVVVDQILVGYGSAGTRSAEFQLATPAIATWGTYATPETIIAAEFQCINDVPDPFLSCTTGPNNVVLGSPLTWSLITESWFKIQSDGDSAIGTDEKLAYGDFQVRWSVSNGVAAATAETVLGEVRCDTAVYLKPNKGCIFPQVLPWIGYSREATAPETEVANHIWDAWYQPDLTYPLVIDKVVPGNLATGNGGWLTRVKNQSIQDANRREARKTCRAIWGRYSDLGLDCDEFPFSSTYEGASAAIGNYSARAIGSVSNQAAGNQLALWYDADRIVSGDAFAVSIVSFEPT